MPVVISEAIGKPSKPRRKPWFNCDFLMYFEAQALIGRAPRAASVFSILPNALGAELVLVVEAATLVPAALELLGGEAFSIRHYLPYIDRIEAELRKELEAASNLKADLVSALLKSIPIKKAAFVRLLMAGDDMTFLYFPAGCGLAIRGRRATLVKTADRQVDYYVDGHEIVCIDGWVKMPTEQTELVLVSMPA